MKTKEQPAPAGERYTVSQVAALAHVTVRALHHYDETGLLVPSERADNGYRLYDDADLARLQQILLFRQLGFGLEAIGQLLEATAHDRRRALVAQRDLLAEQRRQTDRVIRGVDAAIRAMDNGGPMDKKTMFQGFEDFDPSKYEEEARERWGKTDAYKESMRRTKSYSKADWAKIKAEGAGVWERMAALMDQGVEPESGEAMALAEEHRTHIDRWFYDCSHAMHTGVSQMYTDDPRFKEGFEKRREGLAAFARQAIEANGRRA